jgi:hypothetical protein
MFIPGIDEDIEMILRAPQQPEDRLDQAFTNTDYGLADEPEDTFTKHESRPMRKRAAVKECRTEAELAELDRLLLKSVRL